MRKVFVLFLNLSLIMFLLCFSPHNQSFAAGDTYARIKNSNVYIYRSAQLNENVQNKWCILPETFFVKIINNVNENFYKVQYYDLFGYIKKSDINLVNEIPNNPYPNPVTFNLKPSYICHLRSTPLNKSAYYDTISGNDILPYYGKIIGETVLDGKDPIWYLTKFNGEFGYVYSYYTNAFLANQINNEEVTVKVSLNETVLNPLTNIENSIILLAILAPAVLILFLLYKPRKQRVKINNFSKKKHREKIDISQENSYFNDPEL